MYPFSHPAILQSPGLAETKHLYGLQDTQGSWFEVECCHPDKEEERNNNKQTSHNASGDSELGLMNGEQLGEKEASKPPRIKLDYGKCSFGLKLYSYELLSC